MTDMNFVAKGAMYPSHESTKNKTAKRDKKQNTKTVFILRVLTWREPSNMHNNRKIPNTANTGDSVRYPKPSFGTLMAMKSATPKVAL